MTRIITPGVQAALSDPRALRAAVVAEQSRRSGKKSFAEFVKQAWQYVPQVEPLVWNWHMQAIADHAEAVARGRIHWLSINIPPGHAKSVFTSVLWPAWIWSWWPKCQFIFGSYAHNFVIRDARRCLDVISSEWYQTNYCRPGGWRLRSDFGSADNFANTAGGVRFATSTGGAGAGLRAHVIGVDDPINITDISSKAAREEAISWISQTLSQRFVAGYPVRFLLAMQRLGLEDPAAWVINQPGAQCLSLPSEFDPESRCTTHDNQGKLLWTDPRTAPGELLFPTLYPQSRIDTEKSTLGPEGFSAQHLQKPVLAGGNMFKIQNWRFWCHPGTPDVSMARPRGCFDGPANPIELDELDELLISVDATFRKTQHGSFVALHVWGKKGRRRLLLERIHARMDFVETCRALLALIRRWPEARRKLIEGKANGDAIISTLENEHDVIGIEPVNPGQQSKEQRAHAMLPYQSSGCVELPDGALWLPEYIAEHAAFPRAGADLGDDDVDAQSQALQGFEDHRSTMDEWADADLS